MGMKLYAEELAFLRDHWKTEWNHGREFPVMTRAQLDSLASIYQYKYREMVVSRMFEAGTNQALSDSLMSSSGFAVQVPADYEWTTEGDVFLFRKTDADSLQSARHITVTWRTPIPQGIQG